MKSAVIYYLCYSLIIYYSNDTNKIRGPDKVTILNNRDRGGEGGTLDQKHLKRGALTLDL